MSFLFTSIPRFGTPPETNASSSAHDVDVSKFPMRSSRSSKSSGKLGKSGMSGKPGKPGNSGNPDMGGNSGKPPKSGSPISLLSFKPKSGKLAMTGSPISSCSIEISDHDCRLLIHLDISLVHPSSSSSSGTSCGTISGNIGLLGIGGRFSSTSKVSSDVKL